MEVYMKRIAFSCEGNQGLQAEMSMHFGRCPFYTIVDVDDNEVKEVQVIENPYFQNHVPNVVPGFINEQNANVMIAGGMGPRAIQMFEGYGIEVATGLGGIVENVLKAYLDGRVQGASACSHDHGDSCGGH